MAIPPEKRQAIEERYVNLMTYAINDRTRVLSLSMVISKVGAEMPMQHESMKSYITKKYIGYGMTEVIARKFWDLYTGEFVRQSGWSFVNPDTDSELKERYDALWKNRRSHNRFCEDLCNKIESETESNASTYQKAKDILAERGQSLNPLLQEILDESKSILSLIRRVKENEEWMYTEKGKPYDKGEKQKTCKEFDIVKRTMRVIEKKVYYYYVNLVENFGERDMFYRAFEKAIENTRGANYSQKAEMYEMFNIPRR
jgi:hypothetical protein